MAVDAALIANDRAPARAPLCSVPAPATGNQPPNTTHAHSLAHLSTLPNTRNLCARL